MAEFLHQPELDMRYHFATVHLKKLRQGTARTVPNWVVLHSTAKKLSNKKASRASAHATLPATILSPMPAVLPPNPVTIPTTVPLTVAPVPDPQQPFLMSISALLTENKAPVPQYHYSPLPQTQELSSPLPTPTTPTTRTPVLDLTQTPTQLRAQLQLQRKAQEQAIEQSQVPPAQLALNNKNEAQLDLGELTTAQLCEMLRKRGLSDKTIQFVRKEELDGASIQLLSLEHMQTILPLGHCLKLQGFINSASNSTLQLVLINPHV
jgi:hypothetical protein